MDASEPSRRSRFDLPAITAIIVFLAVVACFVAWKWLESHNRDRCMADLEADGVVMSYTDTADEWSSEWPFRDVARITGIQLDDGTFTDDHVRCLRRAFPGVAIYHCDPALAWSPLMGADGIARLPED
jgi:hypothetical protein